MKATRLLDGPIIDAASDPSIGTNIQGPSLIRAPEWGSAPLGRYYLYFADHKGSYIRLAYADDLRGPWRIHAPGTLRIEASHFLTEPPDVTDEQVTSLHAAYSKVLGAHWNQRVFREDLTLPHIASPDAHLDPEHERIRLYFHGLDGLGRQVSRVATSSDGLRFEARPEVLGAPYLRAFSHEGMTYALTMPGQFLRSLDGLTAFEPGPRLFGPSMRHAALLKRDDRLHVLWTRVGDTPERILSTAIDIDRPWEEWRESAETEILRPERIWEGADLPLEPSQRSTAPGPVNQLRDPAIFEEGNRIYLLYAVRGESGIAIAELELD